MVKPSIFGSIPAMPRKANVPKIDMAGVARRVEAIRAATGLDKGDFAEVAGLDPSSYSKVIRSEKPLKSDVAYAISLQWGVSMDFIYRGELGGLPESLAKDIIASLTAQ